MSQPKGDMGFTPPDAAHYLPLLTYTPADILAKLKTVDGPASGLDADTVSGFGIGVECANVLTTFSQVLKGGKYVADSISGLPEAGYYTLDVIAGPVFDAVWAFNISNAKLFVGARAHGTGAILWRQIFNSSVGSTTGTDGNGGQPPAPKAVTNAIILTTSTWGTVFSLPLKRGAYLIQVSLPDGPCYPYSALALITVASGGSATRLVALSYDAGLEIQMSGLYVQVKQNTGDTNYIEASLANLGGT